MSAWGNSFGPGGGGSTEIIYVDSISGSITSTALTANFAAALLSANETIETLLGTTLNELLSASVTVPTLLGSVSNPVLAAALTTATLSATISEAPL